MNADAPSNGFAGRLRSLNGDHAYGWALFAACALLLLPEWGGDAARHALSYDRVELAQGEWWRLFTAHFVHLDPGHALLNVFGLVLMWALFARDFTPLRWLAIYVCAMLSTVAGLWWLSPAIDWYVGASGALHGVMAAGTLAHCRRRDLDGGILALFIVGKLSWEQFSGALPFAGAADTVVDAHLYGAVGGLVPALMLSSRREPF